MVGDLASEVSTNTGIIKTFMTQVDKRFNVLEGRIDALAIDMNIIKGSQTALQKDFQRLAEAAGY